MLCRVTSRGAVSLHVPIGAEMEMLNKLHYVIAKCYAFPKDAYNTASLHFLFDKLHKKIMFMNYLHYYHIGATLRSIFYNFAKPALLWFSLHVHCSLFWLISSTRCGHVLPTCLPYPPFSSSACV